MSSFELSAMPIDTYALDLLQHADHCQAGLIYRIIPSVHTEAVLFEDYGDYPY